MFDCKNETALRLTLKFSLKAKYHELKLTEFEDYSRSIILPLTAQWR